MNLSLTKGLGFVGQIIKYGCVAHVTFEYVIDLVLCAGPSMEPTIYSDDILLTEHLSPRLMRIERGDIVIAKCPTNPKQNVCKRVIAVHGDKVKTGFASYEFVPAGHVWLQGDNSSNSTDSRNYGPVPLGLIRSRAILKVWPLQNFRVLSV